MICKYSYVFSSKLVNWIFHSLSSDGERYSSLITLWFLDIAWEYLIYFQIDEKYVVAYPKLKWEFCTIEIHKCKVGICIHYLVIVCFIENMGWETPYLYKYWVTLDLRNLIMASGHFSGMHLRLNHIFLWRRVFTDMLIWKVLWICMRYIRICISEFYPEQESNQNLCVCKNKKYKP